MLHKLALISVLATCLLASAAEAGSDELHFLQKDITLGAFTDDAAKALVGEWVANGALSAAIAGAAQAAKAYIALYGYESGATISAHAVQGWLSNLERIGDGQYYVGHSWILVSAETRNGSHYADYLDQSDTRGATISLPLVTDPRTSTTYDADDRAQFSVWLSVAWAYNQISGLISLTTQGIAEYRLNDTQGIYDTSGKICVMGTSCATWNTLNGYINIPETKVSFAANTTPVPGPVAGTGLLSLPLLWLARRRRRTAAR